MTTTNAETRPNHVLYRTLHRLVREYHRNQSLVRNRLIEIRRGRLKQGRTPTKALVAHRNAARDNVRDFLDGLTAEEQTVFAITSGTREWRGKYDEMLDPKHDPSP